MDTTEKIEFIRKHVAANEQRDRATFSIDGIKALLALVDGRPSSSSTTPAAVKLGTPMLQALSRMAGNRHIDGVSSIVSAEDRSLIIDTCHALMTGTYSSQREQIRDEAEKRGREAALSTDAEPFGWTSKHVNDGEQHRQWGRHRENVADHKGCIVQPLYAAPPAPAVAVKALEWNLNDSWNVSKTVIGTYVVRPCLATKFAGQWLLRRAQHEDSDKTLYASEDEAKAAAQADYEARIRSALSAQVQDVAGSSLTLSSLQEAHVKRQEEWCPDVKPDLSFRGNELGGECGEAQNVIKKLERERHGWRGSRDTIEHLAEELADVIHCTMLVAITAGIDLQQSVVSKFNDTSKKNGLSTMLAAAPAAKQGDGE